MPTLETRIEGLETTKQNSVSLRDATIPRLWSNEFHSNFFASISSTQIPNRISFVQSLPLTTGNMLRRNCTAATGELESSTSTRATKSSYATHLGSKLLGDALVGISVTFGVSPFLTIVDKAIVESAAGTNSIIRSAGNSIRHMFQNPVEYVRSPTFLLMWTVYGATYTTANAFKTVEEHMTYRKDRSKTTKKISHNNNGSGMLQIASFLGTTVVNSGASMLKDRAYARMFSGQSSNTRFPKSSYAMWAMRDLSVIGSSFLLPDLVSTKLVEHSNGEMDHERALSICQISLPVLAQFVAGPFQYLGLDIYNRNLSHLSISQAAVDRSKQLYKGIAPVIAARIARIIPGYSIGGVANTKLRTAWRKMLFERDVAAMMKTSSFVANNNNGRSEYATRVVALLHSNGESIDKRKKG